jgi:hypothetical protein
MSSTGGLASGYEVYVHQDPFAFLPERILVAALPLGLQIYDYRSGESVECWDWQSLKDIRVDRSSDEAEMDRVRFHVKRTAKGSSNEGTVVLEMNDARALEGNIQDVCPSQHFSNEQDANDKEPKDTSHRRHKTGKGRQERIPIGKGKAKEIRNNARRRIFQESFEFMPFDAKSRAMSFWPPNARHVNSKEASLVFHAFDENGISGLDRDEFKSVLEYLEVMDIQATIDRIFLGEEEDASLDQETFQLWLRNKHMMMRKLSTAERLFYTLDDPHFSVLSYRLNMVIMMLICLSAWIMVFESMPQFRVAPCLGCEPQFDESGVLNTLEVICVLTFTVDYATRFCTCIFVDTLNQHKVLDNATKLANFDLNDKPVKDLLIDAKSRSASAKLWAFIVSPLNLVDLVALAPFFIVSAVETVSSRTNARDLVFVRVLRLFRFVRMLKLQKYSETVSLFTRTLATSALPLLVLIFSLTLLILVFGAVLYMLEQGIWYVCAPLFFSLAAQLLLLAMNCSYSIGY